MAGDDELYLRCDEQQQPEPNLGGKARLDARGLLRAFIPNGIEDLAAADLRGDAYGAETVEIRGIVGTRSQGKGGRTDVAWKLHSFELCPWRTVDGKNVQRPLLVLRPVPDVYDCSTDAPMLSLVHLRVVLSKSRRRAVVEELIDRDKEVAEFVEVLEAMARPVHVDTRTFGRIELNRRDGCFEVHTTWCGRAVQLRFATTETEDLERMLWVAEQLWSDPSTWQARLEDRVVQDLLETANDWAAEDGRPPLAAADLEARLQVHTVHFDEATL